MTATPEKPVISHAHKDKKYPIEKVGILEDLFYLGYASSGKIVIFEDPEKNIKITATFRTLTPSEIRDVSEEVDKFSSLDSRIITDKMETLARGVQTINDMHLQLPSNEMEKFKEDYGREASPLDQARIILIDKIKSVYIIDALYEAYQEFVRETRDNFEDLKKKLKNPKSSS